MRSPIKLVTVLGCWDLELHEAKRELPDTCKLIVNLKRLIHREYCTFHACQSCHFELFIQIINYRLKHRTVG